MLVRFHHVLADGLAALVLLGVLFDSTREASPPQGPPVDGSAGCRPGPSFCSTTWAGASRVRAGLDRVGHPRQLLVRGRTLLRQGVQLGWRSSGSAHFV